MHSQSVQPVAPAATSTDQHLCRDPPASQYTPAGQYCWLWHLSSPLAVGLFNACVVLPAAALSEAANLYREAQDMLPQPNQAFIELDTLTAAAGGPAAGLVGVEVFGSSSVLDDMAHAAVWLAVATGVIQLE